MAKKKSAVDASPAPEAPATVPPASPETRTDDAPVQVKTHPRLEDRNNYVEQLAARAEAEILSQAGDEPQPETDEAAPAATAPAEAEPKAATVPAETRKKRVEALGIADKVVVGDAKSFAETMRRESKASTKGCGMALL